MTGFHNVDGINQKNSISLLEDNIKSFLDWSFLGVGGFVNVNISTSGVSGGNFHTLKPVGDPSQKAVLWEGIRKDWVYESGVSYESHAPISISGIYLNDTFLPAPTGSGSYGYNINYPLGRVVFDNNVSSNSDVKLEYSHRYVQTYKANESVWWKEVQGETYNPSNYKPSGDYSITANHRVQLPAVVIETIPRTVMVPYELGTTENIIIQDIFLHIFAENPTHRNTIADILVNQKDQVLLLYNIDEVVKDKVYPLNAYGNINPTGFNYPKLSQDYRKSYCDVKDSTISELNTLGSKMYNGIVRWSMEIFPSRATVAKAQLDDPPQLLGGYCCGVCTASSSISEGGSCDGCEGCCVEDPDSGAAGWDDRFCVTFTRSFDIQGEDCYGCEFQGLNYDLGCDWQYEDIYNCITPPPPPPPPPPQEHCVCCYGNGEEECCSYTESECTSEPLCNGLCGSDCEYQQPFSCQSFSDSNAAQTYLDNDCAGLGTITSWNPESGSQSCPP